MVMTTNSPIDLTGALLNLVQGGGPPRQQPHPSYAGTAPGQVHPDVQKSLDALRANDPFSADNVRRLVESGRYDNVFGGGRQTLAQQRQQLLSQAQQGTQGPYGDIRDRSPGISGGSSSGRGGGGSRRSVATANPNTLREQDIGTMLAELQLRQAMSAQNQQRFAQNRQASMTPGPRQGMADSGIDPFLAAVYGSNAFQLGQPQQAPAAQAQPQAPAQSQSQGNIGVNVQEGMRDVTNPDALALLKKLIEAGGSKAARTSSSNQQSAQTSLLSTLQGLGGLASGQAFSQPILAGIRRQVMDEAMSRINRQSEAGGSSKSALAQTLRNDALSRMEEAQSRVALEAQLQAAGQQANLGNTLNTIGTQDPLQQELFTLLGLGANLPGQSPFSNINYSFTG